MIACLALSCAVPADDAAGGGSNEGAAGAPDSLPTRDVAVTSQALAPGGPRINATFTRPLPTFLANGTPNPVPGTGPEVLAIRTKVQELIDYSRDVGSATDLYIAAYDWDQFWNTPSTWVNGVQTVTWPSTTCGAPCCSSSAGCCSSAGCPATCRNQENYVQAALDRNLEIKTIFNKLKGKPAVQQWLINAIAAKKLRQNGGSYEGVVRCDQVTPDCSDGGSCLGTKDMHAKFMLVRRWRVYWVVDAPDVDYTSFLTSTNFDYNQFLNWNDAVTVTNDFALYDGMVKYYDRMAALHTGTARPYYPLSPGVLGFNQVDGDLEIVRAYFFPRDEWMRQTSQAQGETQNGREVDVVWRILDNIEDGVVAIAQDQLDGNTLDGRGALLDKLIALADKGVEVRLIVSADQYVGSVKTKLDILRGKSTGLVYKVERARNYGATGRLGVGIHHKFFMTFGDYNGSTFQRLLFMGTQNWTKSGLRSNDEVLFKIKECQTAPCLYPYNTPGSPRTGQYANNEAWIQYANHWNALCDHVVKLDGTAPASSACKFTSSQINIY